MRDACWSAVRTLTRFDAETPMQRLLADNAAVGMLGMARALNGLTGVIDPRDVSRVRGTARLRVADWAPAFLNAARALVAVGAVSLFWIASAWPNGVAAITFCAVIVILLPPAGDCAYSASILLPGKRHERRPGGDCRVRVPSAGDDLPESLPDPGAGPRAARISDRAGVEADVHLRGGRQLPAACSTLPMA